MTSWSPQAAAAYIAASGLETSFYSRYPNAYGAQHAADWMAIWLDGNNVPPPPGPDIGPLPDVVAAVAEENRISQAPAYVPPFIPPANQTAVVFPPTENFVVPPAAAGPSAWPLVAAGLALWFLAGS